jgi:hypothetical protein
MLVSFSYVHSNSKRRQLFVALLTVLLGSVNGKDITYKPAKYSGLFVRNYTRTGYFMSDIDTPKANQYSHELGSRHIATDLTSYTQLGSRHAATVLTSYTNSDPDTLPLI